MNAASASTHAVPADAGVTDGSPSVIVRRHLRFGWISLLVFLTLGLVLEALHGFKVQAYLNVINETRRLMWTLAHAHGTLLGLVHIAFAFTVYWTPSWRPRARTIASCCLMGASLLMPGGFFLGGIWVYAGDPGLGIVLVPVGGILLFAAVLLAALSLKHFEVDGHTSRSRNSRPARSGSR